MGGLVAQRLSVPKAEPFHYFLTSHEIIRRPLRRAKVFGLGLGISRTYGANAGEK